MINIFLSILTDVLDLRYYLASFLKAVQLLGYGRTGKTENLDDEDWEVNKKRFTAFITTKVVVFYVYPHTLEMVVQYSVRVAFYLFLRYAS